MNLYGCVRALFLAILFFGSAGLTPAQTQDVQRRITQAIDETDRVVLQGNTHPMARPQFDRGAAPASLPMNRMLLVLRHTPEQEAAIKDLLAEQQNQSSPRFHQWLAPQQYGQMFGPSDADLQTVTAWLESHGFQVARVTNGRHVIEFSGTAEQVQGAFHTSIHQYLVNGMDHWANNADPEIPAALASVVVGVKSLHNFTPQSARHFAGQFRRSTTTGRTTKLSGPDFTYPAGCDPASTTNFCEFGLGPTDFATIYNVLPLWKAGIDGSGQSIAIVQDSNISVQDVRNFRALFALPANDPEIILDGPDPGLNGDEPEAVIDVSWSGGVAKGAKIKLVVSAGTNTTSGVDLSALDIVDNNIAPIMSESFLQCELFNGTAENQFLNALWQQAAAEGITPFVAAGDSGSAGCDDFDTASTAQFGLAVNGLASTPYDIAVGGTDFLAVVINPTEFFSLTNDPITQASALSYIPELPWNDSCANILFGADPVTDCNTTAITTNFLDIVAGSGGVSSCTISDGQDVSSCKGGYPKPSWQTGVGVPKDGKRDLPDVSLFAGNNFLNVFYIFCEADISPTPSCNLNPPYTNFLGAGGTSFGSPTFAGIMAMVAQKTQSRQGNANFVFYKLAAGENLANCNSTGTSLPANTCIFNDVTIGTNIVPCVAGSPNCTTEGQSVPVGVMTGYTSGIGYDLTSGLGSVNAANLVNNWQSITFTPTTTSLSLFPTSIVHGQAVNVAIDVNAKGGTPTGQVALETNNQNPAGDFTLGPNGKIETTTHLLPGGVSTVIARYGGDPTFAHSDSNSETVIVAPEASNTVISFFALNPTTFNVIPFSGGPYGSLVFLRADVAGLSGFGFATGNVDITDNNQTVPGNPNPFALNSEGNTLTPNSVNTFSVGSHTIRANYLGDPSFFPSTAKPMAFVITMAPTQTVLSASPTTAVKGTPVTVTATINTNSFGNPPTGTVTFFRGSMLLGPPVPVTGSINSTTGLASATASITTSQLPVGSDTVTAIYSGDQNYQLSPATAPIIITITAH
jgi:subtilase family serine protease